MKQLSTSLCCPICILVPPATRIMVATTAQIAMIAVDPKINLCGSVKSPFIHPLRISSNSTRIGSNRSCTSSFCSARDCIRPAQCSRSLSILFSISPNSALSSRSSDFNVLSRSETPRAINSKAKESTKNKQNTAKTSARITDSFLHGNRGIIAKCNYDFASEINSLMFAMSTVRWSRLVGQPEG